MTQSRRGERVVRAAMRCAKLLGRVEAKSCANGDIIVHPEWPGITPYNEEDGGGPGLFTRVAGSARLIKLFKACHAYRPAPRRGGK